MSAEPRTSPSPSASRRPSSPSGRARFPSSPGEASRRSSSSLGSSSPRSPSTPGWPPSSTSRASTGRGALPHRGLLARRGRGPHAPRRRIRLRPSLRARSRRDPLAELRGRPGVRPLQGGERLFFALTAVPVCLLARRLVSPWWAVCAAGLAVAIPSSISVATVMTESLAYLTSAWALYATALALERPTLLRQLAVLGTVAAAFLTRAQLGGLLPVLAPRARAALDDRFRAPAPSRRDLYRLWPSALPLVLAVLVFAGGLVGGALAVRVARRLLGALAQLRPPGAEVGRLPHRRHRGLPRGHPARRRADRPLATPAQRPRGPSARRRSPRSSSPRMRSGSSSSPPSRARRGDTTGCTTATPSTSCRSG